MAGEDYSHGLADVTDREFEERYEAVENAVKRLVESGVVDAGAVLSMDAVPNEFLRDAPLVDGEWVDCYVIELVEWGARMKEKGFELKQPEDYHPLAWYEFNGSLPGVDDTNSAAASGTWKLTRRHMAKFPGRRKDIDGRCFINFDDYCDWRGRKLKGKPRSNLQPGIVTSSWNQWVAQQDDTSGALLTGINVGKLDCYANRYPFTTCESSDDANAQLQERARLLDRLRDGASIRQPSRFSLFLERAQDWKVATIEFLNELQSLRLAVDSLSERYFDGKAVLFPQAADELDNFIVGIEKMADSFNDKLVRDLEIQGRLVLPNERDTSTSDLLSTDLCIDLDDVRREAMKTMLPQSTILIDMAKADTLISMGEKNAAARLVERML